MTDWQVQVFNTLDSTQTYLKNLSKPVHGTVIQALKQTSGYGRHGRTWDDAGGNLSMSLILRPDDINLPYIGVLSLGIGVAICKTLTPYLRESTDITLKWPNDILINHQKISGILLEIKNDTIYIGIGVNILSSQGHNATYLSHHTEKTSNLNTFRDQLLAHIHDIYTQWIDQKYTEIIDTVKTYSFAPGDMVQVKNPDGSAIQGAFIDITEHGALQIKNIDSQETQTITTGDVFRLQT